MKILHQCSRGVWLIRVFAGFVLLTISTLSVSGAGAVENPTEKSSLENVLVLAEPGQAPSQENTIELPTPASDTSDAQMEDGSKTGWTGQRRMLPENLSFSLRFRQEAAMRAKSPVRLSENRTYAYLGVSYDFWNSSDNKYKIRFDAQGRGFYDSVFALTNYYSAAARANGEYQVELRRAVVNFDGPTWSIHLGRQQVIWGEAIGMFIADVVNPKDYRLFLIPDSDDIRIPQAAIDAVKSFGKAGKIEVYWSPDVRVSRLPVKGSEFAFYSPSSPFPTTTYTPDPARRLNTSTSGLRYSLLKRGWDSSVFYLRAMDDLPATSTNLFVSANPLVQVQQRFPMLDRFGATTTKPLGNFVFKAEAVYTRGRHFETVDLGPALKRDMVSGMIGFSYPIGYQYLLDVQYFQDSLLKSASGLYQPGLRNGVAFRVADAASLRRVKPSLQTVVSTNQHDYWISPRLDIRVANALFAMFGFDWFGGTPETQFGQFRDASRAELGLRWQAK